MKHKSLTPYIWLSIFAAIITISLKMSAYFLTGSVGLLSDALESIVNLVAAISALFLLRLAEKPPDENHVYVHTKAEYFSSTIEATLILFASLTIAFIAIERLLHPRPLETVLTGIIISIVASVINLVVAYYLLRVGKQHKSITLRADGHHLLTDVWTSVGVIIGIGIVGVTNIQILDPLVALTVAVNIIYTGYKILKESALGLMDTAISPSELAEIKKILDSYQKHGISYHGLRSRRSATRSFISIHILVPGNWTIQKSHDLVDSIENKLMAHIQKLTVFTHIEPIEDPKSMEDISIDRRI